MSDDLMPTVLGNVHVSGWDEMADKHPTRAATLQALANLQIESALNSGPLPTQLTILHRMVQDGLKLSNDRTIKLNISPTSQKEVNRHINSHLIPRGYVVTRGDYDQNVGGGRGGPSAPWHVVAVSEYLKERLRASSSPSKE